MEMSIRSKFRLLHAQKEYQEGRKISYREVKEATGVAESTLSALANDQITLYAASTLSRLCAYYGCTISDLLEYVPDEKIAA